jgi:hypothetical protein
MGWSDKSGWMCSAEFAQLAVVEDGMVRDEGGIGCDAGGAATVGRWLTDR